MRACICELRFTFLFNVTNALTAVQMVNDAPGETESWRGERPRDEGLCSLVTKTRT